MEYYKKHENKNRENEFNLFLKKIRYALNKMEGEDCALTIRPKTDNREALQILKDEGSFYYECDGLVYDFDFDNHIYIFIDEDWEPRTCEC